MERRVEHDAVGSQHRYEVHKAEVLVPRSTLVLSPSFANVVREWVGELVLVHVQDERHRRLVPANQCQKRRHVEHVGGQNHVDRLEIHILPRQGDRRPTHAPLPKAAGKREQLEVEPAVLGQPFGP